MKRWLPLCLIACAGGNPDTLLTELRVVGITADPPLYDPSVGTTVTATVHDADVESPEVWLFTCTQGTDGCFEESGNLAVSDVSVLGTPVDGELSFDIAPVEVLAEIFAEGGPPMFVWALACGPDLCPILETVATDPDPGSDAWQTVYDWMADPFTAVAELPLVDTSLTFRPLEVRVVKEDEVAPRNPGVEETSAVRVIDSGEELVLRFTVDADGPVIAYPLATAGGFVSTDSDVVDGEVALTLVAGVPDSDTAPPLEVGTDIEVYITFEAEGGGSTLWRERIVVQ